MAPGGEIPRGLLVLDRQKEGFGPMRTKQGPASQSERAKGAKSLVTI